jgi:hypothetical protein
MKKFMVVYTATKEAVEQTKNMPPEEMKKGMDGWMKWAEKCGTGLVDMGTPLGNGQKVTKEGSNASQSKIMGYSILQAEDLEKAKEMLKEHPHLAWNAGCEIELFECMPMPGS